MMETIKVKFKMRAKVVIQTFWNFEQDEGIHPLGIYTILRRHGAPDLALAPFLFRGTEWSPDGRGSAAGADEWVDAEWMALALESTAAAIRRAVKAYEE